MLDVFSSLSTESLSKPGAFQSARMAGQYVSEILLSLPIQC